MQPQAISLAVIALVSISGVLAAAWHGAMNWAVAIPVSVGATASLLIGQRLARHLNADHLRHAFAWLSLLVASMMLLRAAGAL